MSFENDSFDFSGQTNINDDQPGQPGEIQKEATETKMTTTLKSSMGERINKALAKVEEKKKKRVARRAQVCRLLVVSLKPRQKKINTMILSLRRTNSTRPSLTITDFN